MWQLAGAEPLERASSARIDDYLLGGGSNFAVDRIAAERLQAAAPEYVRFVEDNRRFVHAAVHHMIEVGINQFIDLGAGLATATCVHELVHRSSPDAKVAYVETDPVCSTHLELACHNDNRVTVHPTDLFAPAWVLDREAVWRTLDPDRPVGIILTSVLHYEPSDSRVARALRHYHRGVAPNSMIAITHITTDGDCGDQVLALQEAHAELGIHFGCRASTAVADLICPWRTLPDGPTVSRLALGNAWLATKVADS